MTDAIKIEDLRIGSVVEFWPLTITEVRSDGIAGTMRDTSKTLYVSLFDLNNHIARIISTPETDAEKIARLERERDEALARIAELEAQTNSAIQFAASAKPRESEIFTTDAPRDVLGAQFIAGIEPQWSKPIDGPPPKGLPGGSYAVKFSEHGGWIEGGTPSDGAYQSTGLRHRIRLHHDIEWEGGECPVPGDWLVDVTFKHGGTGCYDARNLHWGHRGAIGDIVSFTLTSDGVE